MEVKKQIDPAKYEVGVIIGRFQTNKLHEGHINLISQVLSNHKKTIILIGVSRIQNTKKNPLDFASRRAMISELFPSVIVLPVMDQRYDENWSAEVDRTISMPFGEKKTLIYGSRDSFIPHYKGKFPVIELEPSSEHNATNIREEIARETLETSDFRAGVIYSAFNQRPVTYPTVDICAFNQKGEILMARKPSEKYWRFVGGFVDPTDASFEQAALREFREETGGSCVIGNLKYITSHRVADWRYAKEESGIMTTLYLGEYNMGYASASDDIAEVKWVPIKEFSNFDGVRTKVMPEHRELMTVLVDKVYKENLIPNIGERLAERTDNVTYTAE
jgi:bifunctional NMN adenylyltransferase/nudix hydrolase